ncbi:MAG TPA: Ig-like domain-containing protein [Nitrosopumilaceae archaeon]|nr:Ig-like domain-containing protein [Nitrosopumilaceae archaeon]
MQSKYYALTLAFLLLFSALPSVMAQEIDRDRDGISDDVDDCPVLPEDFEGIMDEDGCPDLYLSTLDTDFDGVSDLYDACPDAKETNNKFEDEDGCPDVSPAEKSKGVADADNDGIYDRRDNCPGQPETYNKFLDSDGCPDKLDSQIDTDRDGLKDTVDQCPTHRETYNKFIDEDGCPDRVVVTSKASMLVDTDEDGVPDWKDRCRTDAEVYNQFKDTDGCPDEYIPPRQYVPGTPDDDKDGYKNDEDKCPTSPETWNKYKDNDGCPDVYPRERLLNDDTYHVEEGTKVTLTGEGTDPNPEDVLSFTWEQTEGESMDLSSTTSANPWFIAPDVENGETKILGFELTVDDGRGGKDTDSVRITVEPVNGYPTADAGPDQAVDPISDVTLTGSGTDPDGDRLSFLWRQINGVPVVLSSSTVSSPTFTAPSRIIQQPLTFELTVTDGFGGKATDTTMVTVGKTEVSLLNANAGPDQTVDEGTPVDLDGTKSSAPNGEELTFAWTQTFGEQVLLDGDDTATPSFIAPDVANGETKVLMFKLTVSAEGLGSATDLVAIRVVTGNNDPTADAGPDQTVYKRSLVKLAGSGEDPDGDKLRYSWKQTGGESVKMSSTIIPAPTFTAPAVANGQTKSLEFTLTVSDRYGGSDSDSVEITVSPFNSPPSANAGSDKIVDEQTEVSLTGSGKDPNKDPLSFRWAQTGGEPVELSSENAASASFTAPVVNNGETKTLTFRLTVDDGLGGKDTDSVIIRVNPVNEAPVADAGSDQTVSENTSARLAGSGDDPDGDALTFRWSQTEGPAVTLSSTTDQYPTFTAPKVDADTTVKLTFELIANDGMVDSEPDTVTFTVKDVKPADLIADAGRDQVVDENVTVTLHGSGNDPSGTTVTLSWVQIEGEEVTLSSSTIASPTFTSPEVANGETKTLVFELTVTDGLGRVKTDTVTITVDPVNADPTAKAGVRTG